MRNPAFTFRDDELILLHKIFHDLQPRLVQFIHLPQLLLLLIQPIHQILIFSDKAQPLPQQIRFAERRKPLLCSMPVLRRMHIILDVCLIFGYLILQVLEVHLHLLLQLDVTADSRLQFLSLALQGRITVDADEVFGDDLDEILH